MAHAESPGRTLTATALATIVSVLPAFLTGGLAVFIRREFGFSETALGAAVSLYYGSATLASVPGGWISERLGAKRAMMAAVAVSTTALIGIGVFAREWWHLTLFLVMAGAANATTQPATVLALARGIPASKQGKAFGVKQSAVPTATLIAGSSVPLIGLTVGWRWAFIGATIVAAAYYVLRPEIPHQRPPKRRGRAPGDAARMPLIALSVSVGCAIAATSTLGPFFVESAVSQGIDLATAGVFLVVGSVSAILGRVASGWMADRREGGHLAAVSWLMTIGGLGFVLLGFARVGPLALAVATALAFGAGWGWPGLLFLSLARQNSHAPAAASGIVLMGTRAGGIVGPVTFGVILERTSYMVAWMCGAAMLLTASRMIRLARRLMMADKASRAPLDPPREERGDDLAIGPMPLQ